MTPRDLLADARAFLSASSSTPDADLRALHVARARSTFAEHERDVVAFARELGHVEAELVRVAKVGKAP